MSRRKLIKDLWLNGRNLAAKGLYDKTAYLTDFLRHQHIDFRGYQRFGNQGPGSTNFWHSPKFRYGVGVLGAGGGIFYYNSLEEVPYTHRWHPVFISIRTERMMGQSAFQQLKASAMENGTLLRGNHPACLAVRRVGTRLAQKASDQYGGGFVKQMQGLDWEFVVIQKNEPNAMVLPGGKVVVYTGILRLLDNDDELAGVLAHEVAHVLARHAAERISSSMFWELARLTVYLVFGIPVPAEALHLALFLPNSRKQETEADVIGMQLAARACYDPAASADVFKKLGAFETKSMPAFLQTHPLSTKRVEKVRSASECFLLKLGHCQR
eukprot:jgi/Botrbrau1/18553/Bobra.0367s0004.2